MIQDWTKYTEYRKVLIDSIKPKFSSIDDDTYYDLFQEAYLEKFPAFESNFDSTKSKNELGYLYRLVINKINDLLKNQPNVNTLIVDIGDGDYEEIGNETDTPIISFAEFLFNVITQRAGIKNLEKELNKHYKTVIPLIKMEAWSKKQALTEEAINILSKKITSDITSEQFYDWAEPTSIVRLKTWVGCS